MKPRSKTPNIAYFSMEIALDANMPTYSGGLGMLAGDTLRSAADLGAPVVAVTLVYRNGYFRQHRPVRRAKRATAAMGTGARTEGGRRPGQR